MKRKILLIGEGLNLNLIQEILSEDFHVEQFCIRNLMDKLRAVPKVMLHNDLFYCLYIKSIARMFRGITTLNHKMKKNILGHVVGTDVRFFEKQENMLKLKEIMEKHKVQIIYASENLREELGIKGDIIPIPIKDSLFKLGDKDVSEQRDVLFYCPAYNPAIYQERKIRQYIDTLPNETITIIGGQTGLSGNWEYPNVQTINNVKFEDMPNLYRKHKKLIRYTSHDGAPKMIYEALLCGCEVWWNEKRVNSVPNEMYWERGKKLILNKVWDVLSN